MREELLYASTVGCDVASGWSPSWVTYMIGVERAVVGHQGIGAQGNVRLVIWLVSWVSRTNWGFTNGGRWLVDLPKVGT